MLESNIIPEESGLCIKTCDACGHHYDELIMARLVLTSRQVVYRYICEDCLSWIKNKGRWV
jgi:hypothetical protein